jgi:hypothetical protein
VRPRRTRRDVQLAVEDLADDIFGERLDVRVPRELNR